MLWVTEQRVKFHLSNIYCKFNVANRTEASRRAQLQNLLPDLGFACKLTSSPTRDRVGEPHRVPEVW